WVVGHLAWRNREANIRVRVALHQVEYALRYCPRALALRDGRIVYDGPSDALTPGFLSDLYGAESEELFLPAAPGTHPANGLAHGLDGEGQWPSATAAAPA